MMSQPLPVRQPGDSSKVAFRRAVTRTKVEATVLGDAVEGLTVEFSRCTRRLPANSVENRCPAFGRSRCQRAQV